MSYDEAKAAFTKEKFWIVEIDLDYCDLDYGIAPCTAQTGVTGEQKCFNTAITCQDRPNYTRGIKTYRFCTKRSPLPSGLDAIPSLAAAPSINGSQIDPSGGLGVRGGISINFTDHPSSDARIDKYVNERTYIPYDNGSFWGKLRARNPYYNNRTIRAYSGYLVDGEYHADNFQQRTYIIENISVNRGMAKVVGKDVLKLADDDRAQYPAESTGSTLLDLDDTETQITLSPAGVGDSEYKSSGWIRLSDEVMSFTRVADVMTIVRGQYNTASNTHSSGDTVQQCEYINDRVENIVYTLLTGPAAVDPSFINLSEWSIEADDNYPYLLEALITEPVGVQALLKELGDNAPHFLYFDERTQLINFTAVKEPPVNINTLNYNENILANSLKVEDKPDERLSDVLVYFGQRDPTKKMDEINNYSQTYIRSDLASSGPDEFGSRKIETIYSRWINNFNKAAAVDLAARKGRRFGITPRAINFSLTARDSDYWLGDNLGIDHPVLQSFTGERQNNIFQITSVKEAGDFQYTALEYLYSEPLPDDPDAGINVVIIGGSVNDINLRDIYNVLFPTPTDQSIVKFVIDNNVEVGSTSSSTYSIETGLWPVGMAPILLFVKGLAAGRGGDRGFQGDGGDGGPCLLMEHDVTIEDITGTIGGGGGGGGGASYNPENIHARGGAGAGVLVLNNGTSTTGGVSQEIKFTYNNGTEPGVAISGTGGGLGANGGTGFVDPLGNVYLGGDAGAAINTNGYNLIIDNGATNILGAII